MTDASRKVTDPTSSSQTTNRATVQDAIRAALAGYDSARERMSLGRADDSTRYSRAAQALNRRPDCRAMSAGPYWTGPEVAAVLGQPYRS